MKKLLAMLLVIAMLLTLAACNKDKNDNTDDKTNDPTNVNDPANDNDDEHDHDHASFDYMGTDLSEYVKLGAYEGLSAEHTDPTLTDEEFIEYVNSVFSNCQDYERITDRPVEEGDTVIVDYRGSADGIDFAGGTSVDQTVVAADNTGYIPGFGPALVGHTPGETFSVDIVFPDPYENNPDMSGKLTTFTFSIKYIRSAEKVGKTYETATDEFISETFGFDTYEEYLAAQRKTAEMQKSYTMLSLMNQDLWQQIVDNSEVIKYPEEEVENIYSQYREMYEYYASYYGVDYDTVLTQYGTTDEEIRATSEEYVKNDLVFYSLVKELGAEVTDAEIDGKIAFFAEMHGADADDVISYYGEDQMEFYAQYDKVMAIVASKADITEVSGDAAAE